MLIKLLTLKIEDKTFALNIDCVERAIPSVEITVIPELPEFIKGIINYQGKIVPVINNRKLFLINDRETELSDIFIIVSVNSKYFCLICDATDDVITVSDTDIVNAKDISTNLNLTKGLIRKDDKILIIYDIDKFISLEEYELLKNIG